MVVVDVVKKREWDDAFYGSPEERRLCNGTDVVAIKHPVTGEEVLGLRPNYMSSLPMPLNRTEVRGKFTFAIFDVFAEVWESEFIFPKMKANMFTLREKGLKIDGYLTTRLGNRRPFLDHEWSEKMPNTPISVEWSGNARQFYGWVPGRSNIQFYIGEKIKDDNEVVAFAKKYFNADVRMRKPFEPGKH